MSVHIGAKKDDVADTILLPGDPLRAKYIAETFLDEVICYNEVRGMLGYTGTFNGKRISVQGTGMGIPSISIYVNELIREYDVKNLIRVGTCGGIQDDVKVRDVILAMTSSTDSNMNRQVFPGFDFSPNADFGLLKKAYDKGTEKGLNIQVGNVLTSDIFYRESMDIVIKLASYGVLAVEMETTALYSLALQHSVKALTILTVSDHIFTGEETTAAERQTTFNDMIEMALETGNEL